MRKILSIAFAALAFAVPPLAAARANEVNDLAAKLDPNAPLFNTKPCQDARTAALAYSDNIGGRVALGLALGLLGPFGLPEAFAADKRQQEMARATVDAVVAGCGMAAVMPYFLDKANGGDAAAQTWMGQAYLDGNGVAKDPVAGASWYEKAADQDWVPAEINLGALYAQGLGVAQDDARAFQLWSKAANDGHPVAETNLASAYENGHGVAQDYGQAVRWYAKAAKQGHATAQFALAALVEKGQGTAQSDASAYKWYVLSVKNGDAAASEGRDRVAARLTPDVLKQADADAAECLASDYGVCDTPVPAKPGA